MTRTAIALMLAAALTASPALADYVSSEGGSTLSLSRNAGDTECWIEQDCPAGEICHAFIQITGDAAQGIADILKARVEKDAQFAEWGLDIYLAKTEGLYCDLTDPDTPRCTMNLNAQTAELEGPLSCE